MTHRCVRLVAVRDPDAGGRAGATGRQRLGAECFGGSSGPERRVELRHRSRAGGPEEGSERDGHCREDRPERAAWRRDVGARRASVHAEAVLQAGVPIQGAGSLRPPEPDGPGVLLRQARSRRVSVRRARSCNCRTK